MSIWRLGGMIAAAALVAACEAPVAARQVSGAEYRAPLAGSTVGVVYLNLTSAADDALVRVESPVAKSVEMHTTTIENGVGRMARTDRVPLPAGEPVAFQPGGLHLMVINPRPADPKAPLPLVLEFESGARDEVQVPLWTPPAG